MKRSVFVFVGAILINGYASGATTSFWNGSSGAWSDNERWTNGIPQAGAHAVINGGSVLLDGVTYDLASFEINGGTLTFTNWIAKLSAADVLVNGGKITHGINSAAATNPAGEWVPDARVWIVCSNLFVASAGAIEADARGYVGATNANSKGYGPGGGGASGTSGGGYGGRGGEQLSAAGFANTPAGATYGDAAAPLQPGSGGGREGGTPGAGGGAIRIEASGVVTVNGSISAAGGNSSGYAAGGSGGAIYIDCLRLEGTNGTIKAVGGSGLAGGRAGGGGGRIAIVYNTGAQVSIPAVRFSAPGGPGHLSYGGYGDIGTLYFPDNRFLTEVFTHSGQWISPGFTEWAPSFLYVTNGWLGLPANGFKLTVTNDLRVIGSNVSSNRLDLPSNAVVTVMGNAEISGSAMFMRALGEGAGPELRVSGNLTLTNSGALTLNSAVTNAGPPYYGALISVTQDVMVASGSTLFLTSHGTNGGSPLLQARDFNLMSGSVINADGRGYQGRALAGSSSMGFGPGAGTNAGAGGYGGRGGHATYGGMTYGSSNAPVDPGSAGGSETAGGSGGRGGGLIRIEAAGAVTLNGTLTANGVGGAGSYYGNGSGGGIYVLCRTVKGGGGTLRANGGSGNRSGGGGGRIAVLAGYDLRSGATSNSVEPGTGTYTGAGTGTVVWAKASPTITNGPPTGVTETNAYLTGHLVATGLAPTEVFVYWGLDNGLTNKTSWATNDYLGTNGIGWLTNGISGLSGGTLYYYRFYATNAWGDDWAVESATVSTIGPPTINNGAGATDIEDFSATLRGVLTGGEPSPQCSIFWGPTDGEADKSAWSNEIPVDASGGAFSAPISNLTANAAYYYRCYASNILGDAWAPTTTNFTTKGPALSLDNVSVVEGGDATTVDAIFTVSLSVTSAIDVAVSFAAAAGTASAVSGDYVDTNGVLNIAAGQVSRTIRVVVSGDSIDEYPSEYFTLDLSDPVDARIADGQGIGTIWDDDDTAEIRRWSGAGSWTNTANWTPQGMPSPADTAIIESGNAVLHAAAMIDHPYYGAGVSVHIAALVVSNGATLVFSNWNTRLIADDVQVNGGKITHALNTATGTNLAGEWVPDARIWIVCTNMLVAAGAGIDANACGYGPNPNASSRGYGPGGGNVGGGGGYGGQGGTTIGAPEYAGVIYGDVAAPLSPGSAGGKETGTGGRGGGAVRIEATGIVTVNGSITANGGPSSGDAGAGSGGAIFIDCLRLDGTNGIISAHGGQSSGRSGGGGGRIAIVYNPGAQISVPAVTFNAAGSYGIAVYGAWGDVGTLYFPNNVLLTEVIGHSGQWVTPGFTAWSPSSLTISNGWIRFPSNAFELTVTNDLRLLGASVNSNRLDMSNALVTVLGNAEIRGGAMILRAGDDGAGPSLNVSGNLTLTNNGTLTVFATATNGEPLAYGALIDVAQDLTVASGAKIYAYSHGTNGGSPFLKVGDMNVMSGGAIIADAGGYQGRTITNASSTGYGPGGGYRDGGAGYGGLGGGINGGPTYGSSNAPLDPGSGGGSETWGGTGGRGGGLIRIRARGMVTLNGTLSANGATTGSGTYHGGGSGGGIYLVCERLMGTTGVLTAKGGGATRWGGGGGRIAVWSVHNRTDGALTANVDGGIGEPTLAGNGNIGTVVWGQLPMPGSIFIVR